MVLALLPDNQYHVFLDNLFSSTDLFRALRLRGWGATGTARANSGLYALFVDAKEEDKKREIKVLV